MDSRLNAKILANPSYRTLVRQRRRYARRLGMQMFCVHVSFIALAAFGRDFMEQPLVDDMTTAGLVIGIGVIVFSVWIARRYVVHARAFDTLIHQIIQDLKQCPH